MTPTNPDEPEQPLGLGPVGASFDQQEHRPAPPAVSPRRYRMMIGALALVLLVAFSVSRLTTLQFVTIGVPAGVRLRWFAAPLAGSSLVGDANVNPPCTIADHDPRALNDCLAAQQGPLVLGFFVTGSAACVREIDTLQALSLRFRGSPVQFAAVAVRAGPSAARAVLRSHRWTIPVAYDRDGAVGALYGVAVCPLIELARRGGIVAERLIGEQWLSRAALAAHVRSLLAS